jgi:hypothetical protein
VTFVFGAETTIFSPVKPVLFLLLFTGAAVVAESSLLLRLADPLLIMSIMADPSFPFTPAGLPSQLKLTDSAFLLMVVDPSVSPLLADSHLLVP